MTKDKARDIISEWFTTRSSAAAIAKRLGCSESGVTRVIEKELYPDLYHPEHVPHFRSGKRFPTHL